MFNLNPMELQKLTTPSKSWFYWKDSKGIYLGCNDLMALDLGLPSAKSIVGRTDYDLPYTEDEAKFCRSCDKNIIVANVSQQFSDKATLSERIIEFSTIKTPIVKKNSRKPLGVFGMSFYLNEESISSHAKIRQQYDFKWGMDVDGVTFSPREISILRLIIRGKTAKEIGLLCNLSKRTIEHHIASIKYKVGARSKSELIEKVIDDLT